MYPVLGLKEIINNKVQVCTTAQTVFLNFVKFDNFSGSYQNN